MRPPELQSAGSEFCESSCDNFVRKGADKSQGNDVKPRNFPTLIIL